MSEQTDTEIPQPIAADYGMMLCGRDGTGDGWWWPL